MAGCPDDSPYVPLPVVTPAPVETPVTPVPPAPSDPPLPEPTLPQYTVGQSRAITVAPAFSGLNASKYLGGVPKGGRSVSNVTYNNFSISNAAAHQGMIGLEILLKLYPGTPANKTHVLAHSMGSQIVFKWIRERTAKATWLDPASVVFYCTGCPESPFGGSTVRHPGTYKAKYPGADSHDFLCPTPAEFHGGYGKGFGLPPKFPWTVYDIKNQYDGHTDAPAAASLSVPEIAECFSVDSILGLFSKMMSSSSPHTRYEDGRKLTDAGVKVHNPGWSQAPNYWAYWLPTYPTPQVDTSGRTEQEILAADMIKRPPMEAKYGRPVTMDTPY